MIEQGIVRLVQADATVAALGAIGGFHAEVPKGAQLPAWTYTFFGGTPLNAIATTGGLTMRHLQVDHYGEPAAIIALAAAVDAVLDDFSGPLPDDEQTVIDNCQRSEEPRDFFDPFARTHRRMVEYEIWFFGQ